MKRKILPIVLLVIFLISLFPATMAQEETDTATAEFTALETETEVEIQTIDSTDCWSDKPDYEPGVDKGFFIWQGTCGKFWWIDWSGDTREKWKKWYKIIHNTEPTTEEPTTEEVLTLESQAATIDANTLTTEEITDLQSTGEIVSTGTTETTTGTTETNTGEVTGAQIATNLRGAVTAKKNIITAKKWLIKKPKLMYKVKGTITSNGQIYDVGVRKFDRRDKIVFRPYKNTITFHGWVGPHFDGIFFRTTGDQVTFDLEFNGQKSTELIYIGKDKSNPDSNPFTLTGEPADKRVCKVGQVIYNKKCVSQVAGIAITPNGLAGDLADKGVPTESLALKPSTARPAIAAKFARPIKIREIAAERIEQARQNFQTIRAHFKQAREVSIEARQNFLKTRQELKTCTENCEELEAQILEEAKTFLINTADQIIDHLNQIKTKVESSEDLSDEEAAEITTKIDAEITELEDAKAKVTAATTKEELKEASKTILQSWRQIKNYARYHIIRLVAAKHGGIIVKMEQLSTRLQKILEKMEANGKDTSTIQPLIDEFNTHIESAKTDYDQAKAKFQEFKALPEPKGEAGAKLIQEAQGYMKESRDHLKEAHQTLKEIVKAIKEAKGEEELTTTTTEETETETETE